MSIFNDKISREKARSSNIRVLLAKPDMDWHDRGLRYIAQVLRDEGMEVILIRYRIAEEVAYVALQEGVDVIGLSFYSPGVMHDMTTVMNSLKERGRSDMLVLVGGTIPDDYVPKLFEMGVGAVFGPGSPVRDIVNFITQP